MRVAVQKALRAARAFKRLNQPTKFQKIKFQDKKKYIKKKFSTTNSSEKISIKQSSDINVPPLGKSPRKVWCNYDFHHLI